MTVLNVREAAPSDAQSLGAFCHLAFKTIAERHGFPPDFPNAEIAAGLMTHMLSRDDVHGFVAEKEGRIVGSNFLWAGGNRVAGDERTRRAHAWPCANERDGGRRPAGHGAGGGA